MANRFKQALAGGAPLAGLWLQLASPSIAEIMAGAGADWLLVDMEHGQTDLATLLPQLQALNGAETPVLVRVPGHDPVTIKRVLDQGAETLLVPMVDSRAQAQALVAAMRYAPAGIRGLAGAVRASDYGRDRDYVRNAATGVALVVQIESRAAIDACAEIAAVDGVDALLVGPGDLAASLGRPGEPRHPDVQAAVGRVLEAGRAAGKAVGTFGLTPQDAAARFAEGFRFVSAATDVALLVRGAEAALAQARG